MPKSHRNERGSKHYIEEPPKKIRNPSTMPESHQKDRGSRHGTEESLKIKGIWTQCRRVAEKMKGLDMMPKNR